jgi:hypothetical protein
VGDRFLNDFDTIWDRVLPHLRNTEGVLHFIDTILMPLTAARSDIDIVEDRRMVVDEEAAEIAKLSAEVPETEEGKGGHGGHSV